MPTQKDLFAKFCPPGLDPIEAWAIRLSKSHLNLTAKAIGHHIGWQALMRGMKLPSSEEFWAAANLKTYRPVDNQRAVDALADLQREGFIRVIHGRDLPPDDRNGAGENFIVGLHVIVGGGR